MGAEWDITNQFDMIFGGVRQILENHHIWWLVKSCYIMIFEPCPALHPSRQPQVGYGKREQPWWMISQPAWSTLARTAPRIDTTWVTRWDGSLITGSDSMCQLWTASVQRVNPSFRRRDFWVLFEVLLLGIPFQSLSCIAQLLAWHHYFTTVKLQ